MNNNSAILQHIWDTSWNIGPAASNCKRAQDRFFSTSRQRPARSSPSRGKVTLRGGVSHRRGRPVDDPDGGKALLGWSVLTMEEAMEWGRHISHLPVPGTWHPGALLQPPTQARSTGRRARQRAAPYYRGTCAPASKAAVVPGRDIGRRLIEGRPCRPRYRLSETKGPGTTCFRFWKSTASSKISRTCNEQETLIAVFKESKGTNNRPYNFNDLVLHRIVKKEHS
jgi:hypothetical protein